MRIKTKYLWIKITIIIPVATFVIVLLGFVTSGTCTQIVDHDYCKPFEALTNGANLIFSGFLGMIAFVPGLIIGIITEVTIDWLRKRNNEKIN